MAMPVNIYKVNIDDGERDRIFNDDLHWVLNEEMTRAGRRRSAGNSLPVAAV
jgi:hypothetical protein